MPPINLEAILGKGTGVPATPRELIVGVPADLVRRRPDVRRAEREVAAQSARIGVAVSDLYPHLSVLGTIGVQAEDIGDLFETGSMIGEISPGFRWDILNYGRLVNNVNVQDARFQQLAYAYQDQVLTAGREVEDAIVSFLQSQEQFKHLDAGVTAALRTVEITQDQYNQGAVDFTAVFVFQGDLTTQQDQLAISQGNIALSLISVYRALGGGWQIRLGGDGAPGEIIHPPAWEGEELPKPLQMENEAAPFLPPQTPANSSAASPTTDAQGAELVAPPSQVPIEQQTPAPEAGTK
jgi:outer membrane protein TolC